METGSLGQGLVNRTLHMLLYSGKLSREKTFAVLWLFVKVFSAKFGGVASFGAPKASNPQNFSSIKLYFSPIRGKVFSLKSFPLYDIQLILNQTR